MSARFPGFGLSLGIVALVILAFLVFTDHVSGHIDFGAGLGAH